MRSCCVHYKLYMLAISIAHFVVPQFPTCYKYHCCTHNKTHALTLIITQFHISQLTTNSNITIHTIWPLWHSSVLYHFGDASKLHYFVATDLATYYSWAMNTAGCEITSCQWLLVGSKAFLKLLLCYLDLLYWIWIETQQMVTALVSNVTTGVCQTFTVVNNLSHFIQHLYI